MSDNIIQLNEGVIKTELKDLVRNSVEETFNSYLIKKPMNFSMLRSNERTKDCQGYRSGHYSRNLTTTSGYVKLKVPKLKGLTFETVIIERYKWRECSVEEALIVRHLAGVSVRRVEDITEALWGPKCRLEPSAISTRKPISLSKSGEIAPYQHRVTLMSMSMASS